jgi:formate dehydrogenase
VDSSNPVLNWVDTNGQKKAYKKLDLMVVIDVAMTETAREADYILPASNQFERYEAAFFSEGIFHVRKPVFKAKENTLSEPEIYTRLIKAMGALDGVDLSALKEAARKDKENPGKGIFQMAFMAAAGQAPQMQQFAPIILRETLGEVLPEGAENAAFVWLSSQMFASRYAKGIKNAFLIKS